MNINRIKEIISKGEKLKLWKYKIINSRHWDSMYSEYKNQYTIDTPNEELFKFASEVTSFLSKKFGEYSPEAIKSRNIYNKILYKKLYSMMVSSNSDRTVAKYDMNYMKEVIPQFIDEKLKPLIKLKKDCEVNNNKLNYASLKEICDKILKQANISMEIRTKLCGNILAQGVVKKLWSICKKNHINLKKSNDDIKDLAIKLQNCKCDKNVVRFFSKNFTKLSRAERLRNQSCHAYETAPTFNEVKVFEELWKELEKIT